MGTLTRHQTTNASTNVGAFFVYRVLRDSNSGAQLRVFDGPSVRAYNVTPRRTHVDEENPMTVILGLAGALAYGFADFLGGLASRRVPPIVVTAWVAVIGLVPLLVGLALLGGQFTPGALLWGTVAGISGSVGVLLLYTALAVGPMSVLSPLTSVVAAIVPVGVGVLFVGSRMTGIGIAAIVAAIVAVVLVGIVKDSSGARLTRRGLIAAGFSGCGFGGLVVAYSATSPEDGLAPLVVARVVQVVVMWTGVALVSLRSDGGMKRIPARGAWTIIAFCGVLDASANVLIQAALHSGDVATSLPIVSVLNALYPIGTIILAAIVLRERLTRVQIVGLALALAASAVLASV